MSGKPDQLSLPIDISQDSCFSAKIIPFHRIVERSKELPMTQEEARKSLTALFAGNTAIVNKLNEVIRKTDELDGIVDYLKKRVDNISENYLEKIP